MASQIVLALFGSVLLGAVLVALGLRGRRINRHPVCSLCGFDLEGTYPQSITCPECGAGLRRRKGVRIGARRKMWIVASVGAVLVLLPAGVLGALLYAVLTGAEVNQYKPVGLLLWEGRRGNDATAGAALQELLSRVQNQQVSAERVQNIVGVALEIQADLARPWRAEWGDIIETAKVNGAIGNEEYLRFLEQAPVLEFAIRPQVGEGDPIAVEATLAESRIGSGSSFTVTTEFTKRSIDGQAANPRMSGGHWAAGLAQSLLGAPVVPPEQPGYFHVSGAKGVWAGSYGQCCGTLEPSEPLEPGPHMAEVSLRMTVNVPPAGGVGTWVPLPGTTPTRRAVRSATLPFVVVPRGEATVRLVEPTPEQVAAFRLVEPEQIQVQSAGLPMVGGKWAHISFMPAADLPLDAAFEVKVRVGGSVRSVGQVFFRAPDPNQPPATGPTRFVTNQQWVSLELPASFDGKAVTVVLEPDVDAALGTVDMTEIYGATIEFRDVKVMNAQW